MSWLDWLAAEPKRDALPIYDEAGAVRYLKALGYAVIKAKQKPVPQAGECWVPTRGESQMRWVRSVGLDKLSYANEVAGIPETISRRSWNRWLQRARAKRS